MTLNLIDEAKNTNGIAVDLPEPEVGEGVVQASNTITPGMAVTKGTAAGELIPDNDSGKSSGYALDNVSADDPADGTAKTLRTNYAAGKRVRYGRRAGARFMGLIASGQNLTKDARLKTANGKFVAGTEGTDKLVAVLIQEGGTGGALGADTHLLCRWGAY